MAHAEDIYLFRHDMMRAAAYDLQPLQDRAVLHAHAYAIIETLAENDPDTYAAELADHARDAANGDPDQRRRHEMQLREAGWLKHAMHRARERSSFRPALDYGERLLNSEAADLNDRHTGGVMAVEMAAALGEFDRVSAFLDRIGKLESEGADLKLRPAYLLAEVSAKMLPARELDTAREMLKEAREIAHEVGDKLAEARAIGYMGNVESIGGDNDTGAEFYRAALALFRELNHERGISTSLGNLGLLHRRKGELDEALRLYGEALEIDRKIGHREGVARHFGNLGIVQREQGSLEEAADTLEEAGELMRQLGDRIGRIRNLLNLGDVRIRLGQRQVAIALYRQSEALARDCGLQHFIADALYFGAVVLLDDGDAVRGEPPMCEAAAMYEQLNDRASAAESWHRLAQSAFSREDFEPALRYARSCLSNLSQSTEPLPRIEYEAQAILAESALAMESYGLGAKAAARAVELANEHESDPIRLATLKAIAKKYPQASAS